MGSRVNVWYIDTLDDFFLSINRYVHSIAYTLLFQKENAQ